MTKAHNTLPNFLRAWRKEKRLTQERLAELAGFTPGAISQFETGVANLTVPSLVSLAGVLGCKPGDILSYPPGWNAAGVKIKDEAEILAMLGRIDGLSDTDIDIAFGVIRNALAAKRAGPAPLESRDQPQDASPRREPKPSRKKARLPAV